MTDPVTHKRILTIAVPLVISNASVPILGLVDTGVVGQMGQAALIGAVGIGAIILSAVYWIFGFLRMGTVGLTSQAHGAGDRAEVSAMFFRSIWIGGAAGLALIALQVPIFQLAFYVAPASEQVESLASDYMAIRIFSSPAAIALYGVTGWLIAQERAFAVLAIQIWMNGLNIILDVVFVIGLELGVSGVAWATFIAEWSGLALGLWFCRDAFAGRAYAAFDQIFDTAKLKAMAMLNTDILIRSVLLQAAFVSFLFLGSDLGDVTLAANQILIQFLHLTAYAMDGFAFAAEALVGQAFGAKIVHQLRRSAIMTSIWGAGICVCLALAFWLGGGLLIDAMTTAPDVRVAARAFLIWMIVGPLLGWPSWMLDGIFIGATRSRDMRNMMILSTAGYFLLIWITVPNWGNHGLWFSITAFYVLRAVTLGARYPSLERSMTVRAT